MRSLAAITTDKPDTQTFFYLVIAVFESSSDCRVSDSRGGLKDTSLTDKINFLSIQLNRTVRSHGPVKNVTIMIEETLTSKLFHTVYTTTCVCVCVCVYVCVCVFARVCAYMCVLMCVSVCVSIWSVCVYMECVYVHVHTYMCARYKHSCLFSISQAMQHL